MSDGPDVSVVCSTYQRAHRLPNLLAALEAQTYPAERFEVVIVDDGSTDGTSQLVEAFAANSRLDLRLVSLPKNTGRSAGRNTGWRAARAPVIAFTDDDCSPSPGWLESGLHALKGDVTVVVGRTAPNPAQAGNSGVFSRSQNVDRESGMRYMHTCNIFYRRADLEAVGGLDAAFNAKGGEDTDLGWRVLDHGGNVVFAEDALVFHDVTKGNFRGAVREASLWRDIPRVAARHPHRVRPLLVHGVFWKKSHEYVLLAEAGVVAAALLRSPVPLLAFVPWLIWRGHRMPIVRGRRRFFYIPHAFVIDAVEVVTMVRGSARNKTLVL